MIEFIWVSKELTVSLKFMILFIPPDKNINNNKNALKKINNVFILYYLFIIFIIFIIFMKLDIKFWTNFQKWLRFISGFIIIFITLVLYFDTKIILKNNYEETNNKLYLILLFIVMVLQWNFRILF